MRKHERRWSELCGLVIILEGLVVIALDVESSSELVATFGAHRFVFRVVKRMQGEMLDFVVILREFVFGEDCILCVWFRTNLFEEEMVR